MGRRREKGRVGEVRGVCAAPRGSDTSGPATGACEAAEGWLGRGRRRRRRFAGGTRLLREHGGGGTDPAAPCRGEKQGKRCSSPHSLPSPDFGFLSKISSSGRGKLEPLVRGRPYLGLLGKKATWARRRK